jgi:hypothetical protein
MDITPEEETSYTTQYQEVLQKNVESEYCAKHRYLPITKPKSILCDNLFSSTMASRSGQSSYDPYDLSSDNEEYLMPNHVAATTPRQSDHAARQLTPTRILLISLPELPQS